MKNNAVKNLVWVIVALSPLLVLTAIWSTLPAIVPTHFGLHGPDQYRPKSSLYFVSGFVSAITVGVYFLLQNIHKLDPKRQSATLLPIFNKMAIGLVLFMAALNTLVVLMSVGNFHLERFMVPLIGLLFAFLGYVMKDTPPNYFAGIKLPWTLHSDYNWKKTHTLTGNLWMLVGGGMAIPALFLPDYIMAPILVGCLAVVTIIPIIYSYRLYRKEKANPNIAAEDPDYNK